MVDISKFMRTLGGVLPDVGAEGEGLAPPAGSGPTGLVATTAGEVVGGRPTLASQTDPDMTEQFATAERFTAEAREAAEFLAGLAAPVTTAVNKVRESTGVAAEILGAGAGVVAAHLERRLVMEGLWADAKKRATTLVDEAAATGDQGILKEAETLAALMKEGPVSETAVVELALQVEWLSAGVEIAHELEALPTEYPADQVPRVHALAQEAAPHLRARHLETVRVRDEAGMDRMAGQVALVPKLAALEEGIRTSCLQPLFNQLASSVGQAIREDHDDLQPLHGVLDWTLGAREIEARVTLPRGLAVPHTQAATARIRTVIETLATPLAGAVRDPGVAPPDLPAQLVAAGVALEEAYQWWQWTEQLELGVRLPTIAGEAVRANTLPKGWRLLKETALATVASLWDRQGRSADPAHDAAAARQLAATQVTAVLTAYCYWYQAGELRARLRNLLPTYPAYLATWQEGLGLGDGVAQGLLDPAAALAREPFFKAWQQITTSPDPADQAIASRTITAFQELFPGAPLWQPPPRGTISPAPALALPFGVAPAEGDTLAATDTMVAWETFTVELQAGIERLDPQLWQTLQARVTTGPPSPPGASSFSASQATALLTQTVEEWLAATVQGDRADGGHRGPAEQPTAALHATLWTRYTEAASKALVPERLMTMGERLLAGNNHPEGPDLEEGWTALVLQTLHGTNAGLSEAHRVLRQWGAMAAEAHEIISEGQPATDPRHQWALRTLHAAGILVQQLEHLEGAAPLYRPDGQHHEVAKIMDLLTFPLHGHDPATGTRQPVTRTAALDWRVLATNWQRYTAALPTLTERAHILQRLHDWKARMRQVVRTLVNANNGPLPLPDSYYGVGPLVEQAERLLGIDEKRPTPLAKLSTGLPVVPPEALALVEYLEAIPLLNWTESRAREAARLTSWRDLIGTAALFTVSGGVANYVRGLVAGRAFVSGAPWVGQLIHAGSFLGAQTGLELLVHGQQGLIDPGRSVGVNVANVGLQLGMTALTFHWMERLLRGYHRMRVVQRAAKGIYLGGNSPLTVGQRAAQQLFVGRSSVDRWLTGAGGIGLEVGLLRATHELQNVYQSLITVTEAIDPERYRAIVAEACARCAEDDGWGKTLGIILSQRLLGRPLRPLQARLAQAGVARQVAARRQADPEWGRTWDESQAALARNDLELTALRLLMDAVRTDHPRRAEALHEIAAVFESLLRVRERLFGHIRRIASEGVPEGVPEWVIDPTHGPMEITALREGVRAYAAKLERAEANHRVWPAPETATVAEQPSVPGTIQLASGADPTVPGTKRADALVPPPAGVVRGDYDPTAEGAIDPFKYALTQLLNPPLEGGRVPPDALDPFGGPPPLSLAQGGAPATAVTRHGKRWFPALGVGKKIGLSPLPSGGSGGPEGTDEESKGTSPGVQSAPVTIAGTKLVISTEPPGAWTVVVQDIDATSQTVTVRYKNSGRVRPIEMLLTHFPDLKPGDELYITHAARRDTVQWFGRVDDQGNVLLERGGKRWSVTPLAEGEGHGTGWLAKVRTVDTDIRVVTLAVWPSERVPPHTWVVHFDRGVPPELRNTDTQLVLRSGKTRGSDGSGRLPSEDVRATQALLSSAREKARSLAKRLVAIQKLTKNAPAVLHFLSDLRALCEALDKNPYDVMSFQRGVRELEQSVGRTVALLELPEAGIREVARTSARPADLFPSEREGTRKSGRAVSERKSQPPVRRPQPGGHGSAAPEKSPQDRLAIAQQLAATQPPGTFISLEDFRKAVAESLRRYENFRRSLSPSEQNELDRALVAATGRVIGLTPTREGFRTWFNPEMADRRLTGVLRSVDGHYVVSVRAEDGSTYELVKGEARPGETVATVISVNRAGQLVLRVESADPNARKQLVVVTVPGKDARFPFKRGDVIAFRAPATDQLHPPLAGSSGMPDPAGELARTRRERGKATLERWMADPKIGATIRGMGQEEKRQEAVVLPDAVDALGEWLARAVTEAEAKGEAATGPGAIVGAAEGGTAREALGRRYNVLMEVIEALEVANDQAGKVLTSSARQTLSVVSSAKFLLDGGYLEDAHATLDELVRANMRPVPIPEAGGGWQTGHACREVAKRLLAAVTRGAKEIHWADDHTLVIRRDRTAQPPPLPASGLKEWETTWPPKPDWEPLKTINEALVVVMTVTEEGTTVTIHLDLGPGARPPVRGGGGEGGTPSTEQNGGGGGEGDPTPPAAASPADTPLVPGTDPTVPGTNSGTSPEVATQRPVASDPRYVSGGGALSNPWDGVTSSLLHMLAGAKRPPVRVTRTARPARPVPAEGGIVRRPFHEPITSRAPFRAPRPAEGSPAREVHPTATTEQDAYTLAGKTVLGGLLSRLDAVSQLAQLANKGGAVAQDLLARVPLGPLLKPLGAALAQLADRPLADEATTELRVLLIALAVRGNVEIFPLLQLYADRGNRVAILTLALAADQRAPMAQAVFAKFLASPANVDRFLALIAHPEMIPSVRSILVWCVANQLQHAADANGRPNERLGGMLRDHIMAQKEGRFAALDILERAVREGSPLAALALLRAAVRDDPSVRNCLRDVRLWTLIARAEEDPLMAISVLDFALQGNEDAIMAIASASLNLAERLSQPQIGELIFYRLSVLLAAGENRDARNILREYLEDPASRPPPGYFFVGKGRRLPTPTFTIDQAGRTREYLLRPDPDSSVADPTSPVVSRGTIVNARTLYEGGGAKRTEVTLAVKQEREGNVEGVIKVVFDGSLQGLSAGDRIALRSVGAGDPGTGPTGPSSSGGNGSPSRNGGNGSPPPPRKRQGAEGADRVAGLATTERLGVALRGNPWQRMTEQLVAGAPGLFHRFKDGTFHGREVVDFASKIPWFGDSQAPRPPRQLAGRSGRAGGRADRATPADAAWREVAGTSIAEFVSGKEDLPEGLATIASWLQHLVPRKETTAQRLERLIRAAVAGDAGAIRAFFQKAVQFQQKGGTTATPLHAILSFIGSANAIVAQKDTAAFSVWKILVRIVNEISDPERQQAALTALVEILARAVVAADKRAGESLHALAERHEGIARATDERVSRRVGFPDQIPLQNGTGPASVAALRPTHHVPQSAAGPHATENTGVQSLGEHLESAGLQPHATDENTDYQSNRYPLQVDRELVPYVHIGGNQYGVTTESLHDGPLVKEGTVVAIDPTSSDLTVVVDDKTIILEEGLGQFPWLAPGDDLYFVLRTFGGGSGGSGDEGELVRRLDELRERAPATLHEEIDRLFAEIRGRSRNAQPTSTQVDDWAKRVTALEARLLEGTVGDITTACRFLEAALAGDRAAITRIADPKVVEALLALADDKKASDAFGQIIHRAPNEPAAELRDLLQVVAKQKSVLFSTLVAVAAKATSNEATKASAIQLATEVLAMDRHSLDKIHQLFQWFLMGSPDESEVAFQILASAIGDGEIRVAKLWAGYDLPQVAQRSAAIDLTRMIDMAGQGNLDAIGIVARFAVWGHPAAIKALPRCLGFLPPEILLRHFGILDSVGRLAVGGDSDAARHIDKTLMPVLKTQVVQGNPHAMAVIERLAALRIGAARRILAAHPEYLLGQWENGGDPRAARDLTELAITGEPAERDEKQREAMRQRAEALAEAMPTAALLGWARGLLPISDRPIEPRAVAALKALVNLVILGRGDAPPTLAEDGDLFPTYLHVAALRGEREEGEALLRVGLLAADGDADAKQALTAARPDPARLAALIEQLPELGPLVERGIFAPAPTAPVTPERVTPAPEELDATVEGVAAHAVESVQTLVGAGLGAGQRAAEMRKRLRELVQRSAVQDAARQWLGTLNDVVAQWKAGDFDEQGLQEELDGLEPEIAQLEPQAGIALRAAGLTAPAPTPSAGHHAPNVLPVPSMEGEVRFPLPSQVRIVPKDGSPPIDVWLSKRGYGKEETALGRTVIAQGKVTAMADGGKHVTIVVNGQLSGTLLLKDPKGSLRVQQGDRLELLVGPAGGSGHPEGDESICTDGN